MFRNFNKQPQPASGFGAEMRKITLHLIEQLPEEVTGMTAIMAVNPSVVVLRKRAEKFYHRQDLSNDDHLSLVQIAQAMLVMVKSGKNPPHIARMSHKSLDKKLRQALKQQ